MLTSKLLKNKDNVYWQHKRITYFKILYSEEHATKKKKTTLLAIVSQDCYPVFVFTLLLTNRFQNECIVHCQLHKIYWWTCCERTLNPTQFLTVNLRNWFIKIYFIIFTYCKLNILSSFLFLYCFNVVCMSS